MTTTVTLHIGDVRDVMATLPDNCTDVLITSPPFLALRSYLPADHPDKHRELGSEPTPAAFLDSLYGLTQEWGRLVPEWGSICVELGDTMSGSGLREGQPKFRQVGSREHRPEREGTTADGGARLVPANGGNGWPLAKSMCLIPHLYTIGLAYGHNPLTGLEHPAGQWRIRNVITWARPNPPVGSLGKRSITDTDNLGHVTERPPNKRTGDQKFRPACSYITVACRGTGRYFDLDAVRNDDVRAPSVRVPEPKALELQADGHHGVGMPATGTYHANGGAPPLDWHQELDGDWLWKLATAPYPGAHYATYPLTLPRRLVLAMCPLRVCTVCGWPSERIVGDTEYVNSKTGKPVTTLHFNGERRQGGENHWDTSGQGDRAASAVTPTLGWSDCGHNNWRPGTVLDPFAGTGTTAVAAALESRDCVLIDLDARNAELVDRRLREALHVTNYTVDGNVHIWELEEALPNQKTQSDGQANLLDLL